MGPLTLMDLVGLDVLLDVMDVLWDEFRRPRYAAAPLLRRMVAVSTCRLVTAAAIASDSARVMTTGTAIMFAPSATLRYTVSTRAAPVSGTAADMVRARSPPGPASRASGIESNEAIPELRRALGKR